jgi:ferredoxin
MKGLIFYYSTTGNTKLICDLICNKITDVKFEMYSINESKQINMEEYDIFGFASFTDQLQLPYLMKKFIKNHNISSKKYAFVLNTYGSISGRTLIDLINAAKRSGYYVFNAVSIHTPENFPPMIKKGFSFTNQPSDKMVKKLKKFINRLNKSVADIVNKKEIKKTKSGILQNIIPELPYFLSGLELGNINCDITKCTKCMVCEIQCPAKAIKISESFEINNGLCQKCWRCYNKCPSHAISGTKFKHGYQYQKINEEYRKKIESIKNS